MSNNVRVRFAPSPTGPLHIGGVRTALYNYCFARKNGGVFILRVEDTDQTRFVPGAEQYIIESLEWCGIRFDEGVHVGGEFGPYRQSERKEIYKPYAEQLVRDGHAYYAFDTPEDLEARREAQKKISQDAFQYDSSTRMSLKNSLTLPEAEVGRLLEEGHHYVIRIKIPANEEVHLHDQIRGDVSMQTNTLDDKVLFKSDGMPTYHLANVVDDYLMKITHVIRGEEWLPSAPLHVLLYRFLGWEDSRPQFAHLPLLLKPEGNGKLSKRDGDRLGFPVFPMSWVDPISQEVYSGYKESGFLPDAFMNFLAMLGWNPGTEQEIFDLDALSQAFSLEKVHKAGAKFDFEKGKWFNQQYIKEKDNAFLAGFLEKEVRAHGFKHDNLFIENVCGLIKERVALLTELWDATSYFFSDPIVFDQETIKKRWKPETPGIVANLRSAFTDTDFSEPSQLEEIFKKFLETNQLNTGAVLSPLRLVVTGKAGGPGMFDIMHLIGKEATLRRMDPDQYKI
ncbi:MAG: glutamate--tRNA ligase [Bacteroidota bacterium]